MILSLLFLVIFSILLINSVVVIVCNPGQKIGDLNNDGIVNATDTDLFLEVAVGNIPKPSNLCCVDLNKDGIVNATDTILTTRIVNGLDNTSVCETDLKVLQDKIEERINTKLEEVDIKLDENEIYQIHGKKKAMLFFLIPVRENIEGQADSETGNVIIIKKGSWWGLFSKRY